MDKDSTYVGMNKLEASTLSMFLEDRKMKKILIYPKPVATFYPMTMIPGNATRLDGFIWLDYIRPKDKADIMEWKTRMAGDEQKKSTRSNKIPLPNQNLFNKKTE